jgi:pimeloyl-ACP methyl ester carboxylesterase
MTLWYWLILILLVVFLSAVLLARPVVKRQPQQVFLDPGQFGVDFRVVSFATTDGIPLVGWWIPSPGSARTVIFLHGYAGSCDPDLKYAPAFHQAGYNLLLFDFRAHGRSGGKLTSIGALEVEDCLAAIRFAREQGCDRIGLLGFSMGGRVALLTAAGHPGAVKAVLSDGGPARLVTAIAGDIAKRHLPKPLCFLIAAIIVLGMSIWTGKALFLQEPLTKARNLPPLPVFFIHGGRDVHTTSAEMERMLKAAGENASLWCVPQAGHRDAEEFVGEEYLSRVIAFFNHHLQ